MHGKWKITFKRKWLGVKGFKAEGVDEGMDATQGANGAAERRENL